MCLRWVGKTWKCIINKLAVVEPISSRGRWGKVAKGSALETGWGMQQIFVKRCCFLRHNKLHRASKSLDLWNNHDSISWWSFVVAQYHLGGPLEYQRHIINGSSINVTDYDTVQVLRSTWWSWLRWRIFIFLILLNWVLFQKYLNERLCDFFLIFW